MKAFRFFSAVAIAALAVFACKPEQDAAKPSLSLEPANVTVEAKGGTQTVTVKSNVDWTATTTSDWVSIGTKSGNGNGVFEFSVSENTATDAREAKVKFSSSTVSAELTVNQAGLVLACQQVYFPVGKSDLIILKDDEKEVEIEVRRNKSDAAITVPVTSKVSEGVKVPESVSFAANEKSTMLKVSIPAASELPAAFNIELELGGVHVDPFLDGVETVYAAQVARPLVTKAKTWIATYGSDLSSKYGQWYTDVTVVSDNLILFPNFWNSGITVKASGLGKDSSDNTMLEFTADYGYHEADSEYAGCHSWWLYDDASSSWASLYPHGADAWFKIYGMDFYYNDAASSDLWAWYDAANSYITFTASTVYYSDKSNAEYWQYICMSWDEDQVADFEPYLPEQQIIVKDGNTECKIEYGTGGFTEPFYMTGSWDGNQFVIKDFMNSGSSLTIVTAANGQFWLESEIGSYDTNGYFTFDSGTVLKPYADGSSISLYLDPSGRTYGYSKYNTATNDFWIEAYIWTGSQSELDYIHIVPDADVVPKDLPETTSYVACYFYDHEDYGKFYMNAYWSGDDLVIEDFMHTGKPLTFTLPSGVSKVTIKDSEIGYNDAISGGNEYFFYANNKFVPLYPFKDEDPMYMYFYLDNAAEYSTNYMYNYSCIYLCTYIMGATEWEWYDTLVIEDWT